MAFKRQKDGIKRQKDGIKRQKDGIKRRICFYNQIVTEPMNN